MTCVESIPDISTLDDALGLDAELKGVELRWLAPGDLVKVHTRNSDYEIFLLDPQSGHALVHGGSFFNQPREATVCGSSFGGCMLKLGWIGIGLRMEVFAAGQSVITSPVQEITIEHEAETPSFTEQAATL